MPSNGDFGGSGFAGATTPASGANFSSTGSPVGVGGVPGSGGLFGWRCWERENELNNNRRSARKRIKESPPREKRIPNLRFVGEFCTHCTHETELCAGGAGVAQPSPVRVKLRRRDWSGGLPLASAAFQPIEHNFGEELKARNGGCYNEQVAQGPNYHRKSMAACAKVRRRYCS